MAFCGWGGEKWKDHFEAGTYNCSQCNEPLFRSSEKFEHDSPWPAFNNTVKPNSVTKKQEGRTAYKVSCSKCGQGLGHEFIGDGSKEGCSRF